MAIQPGISLQVKPTNVREAIIGGQEIGRGFRQQNVRDQILEQTATTQQQSIEQTQGSFLNKFATNLKGVPIEDRASIVAQNMQVLEGLGIEPQDILTTNLTDQGLDQIILGTQPFIDQQSTGAVPSGIQEFQFLTQGLTESEKNKAAKVNLGLEARAGRGQIQQVSPGVFKSFDPNTNTLSDPFKFDANNQRVPLTRQEQVDLKLAEDVTGITTRGAAETGVAVSEAEQVGEVELDIASRKKQEELRLGRVSTLKKQFSDQLRAADANLPRLLEAFSLAEEADQGLTGAGKLVLSRLLPGLDVADTAALDAALTNLALAELDKFKGTTTDFEFGVTQSISGKVIGSKAANLARIASLQRNNWFLKREAQQFNNWIDGGGDPDRFSFNIQEKIQFKKRSFTLKLIRDTAARNHMSIESVIELLNKQE